jgi:hypothetical protein
MTPCSGEPSRPGHEVWPARAPEYGLTQWYRGTTGGA